MRIALLIAVSAAALAATPARAAAAPPANDNYLASTTITAAEYTNSVDTTEATTQGDLWNPSRDGQPLGGSVAETTNCKGTVFGKTVWYDLHPQSSGYAQIRATGFPTVVAVYEYGDDARIGRMVDCSTTAATEDLLVNVVAKRNYTVQIGGASGAGGMLAVSVDYFADSDGDGELDPLDDCPTVPGIHAAGGCPPKLPVVPALRFDPAGGGVRINSLSVDSVPKGAKLVAKCRGCGTQTVKAKKAGRVTFSGLAGRVVPAGANVELRVTLGRTGTGKYRFGATGSYFKWPVQAGGLGKRLTRCIAVGTGKVERCK